MASRTLHLSTFGDGRCACCGQVEAHDHRHRDRPMPEESGPELGSTIGVIGRCPIPPSCPEERGRSKTGLFGQHRFGDPADSGVPWLCAPLSRGVCLFSKCPARTTRWRWAAGPTDTNRLNQLSLQPQCDGWVPTCLLAIRPISSMAGPQLHKNPILVDARVGGSYDPGARCMRLEGWTSTERRPVRFLCCCLHAVTHRRRRDPPRFHVD